MSDKPKCPVFGCTIPRGIAHSHPAGVSAVMRDPVEPLTYNERVELQWLRTLKAQNEAVKTFVVPSDAPMHGGRKLRDALLMAGVQRRPETKHQFAIKSGHPSRSFVKTVGRIALWVIVGAAAIAFTGLVLYVRINELAWWWS